MKATEITRRYHEAWTVAMPTRLSPVSRKKERLQSGHYPGASGEAFPAYLKGLWTAFPDFHLELLNAGEIEPGCSLIIGERKAPIPAKELTAVSLPDVPLL
jgi:hypothetical protein